MIKVGISDCVKQIIAVNKELDEHDSRQDAHMMFIHKNIFKLLTFKSQGTI